MENKRKNVYIVIFVITTIIASCVAVYFGIMGKKETEKLQAKVDELNSVNSNLDKNSQVVEQQEKVVEKVVEKSIIAKFDPKKVKNNPSNITYTNNLIYNTAVENLGINVDTNGNVKVAKYENDNSIDLTLNGVNGKVIEVCQGILEDGANEGIVFLTEDGSVYMADYIYAALNGNKTLNAKKINNIPTICKLYLTMSSNQGRARATFVGVALNGDCYDLYYEYRK